MATLHQILFGIYPYVAVAVLLLGSLVRFDREQYGWRSGSSQLLRKRQLRWGSNLFHIGILAILGGHAVGLLTPPALFHAFGIEPALKQMMAIALGGLAGLACFAGMTLLIHRRLSDARLRATSGRMDIAILLLLYAQLILGLSTIPFSLGHPDGQEMLKFMAWAQGLVTLDPGAAGYIADVGPVFKAHIALGFVIVLLFPFSRLVHIWSAPISYAWRPHQLVRRRGRALPRGRVAHGAD